MNKLKAILAWLFFLLIYSEFAAAQQYDKVWILGVPMASMVFYEDTVVNQELPNTTLPSFITIGDICNSNGNLLFYTNGVNVYNVQGNIMVNGDSLSAPSEYYSQVVQGGMPSNEGVVILPKPGDTNLYYIFHYTPTDTLDTNDNAGYESLNLYYSIVDMRQDSGRGAVISKNNPIIQNELLSFSRLAACRHANGRDWWIIKNAWHENLYYEFLLTPDGVAGPFIQQIGPLYGKYNEQPAYAAFSPDGSKYASVTGVSDIVLMDFDRCTGLFSNPDSFYNNQEIDTSVPSISGGVSLCFSPSGRFLYVTCPQEINQYDLSPLRTADSIRIFTDSITEFYQIDIIQVAPNDKMYISCWNGGSYAIHIINRPDSLGAACDFQFLGQPVLSQSPQSLPYFPNFRLGALSGSPCDTLTEIQAIAAAHPAFATVTPNPASGRATVVYFSAGSQVNKVELYDGIGGLVLTKTDPTNSGRLDLDVSHLAPGIYFVHFTSDDKVLLSTKLIVEH